MPLLLMLLAAATFRPEIPRTWTDTAVAKMEVPLAKPLYSPVHMREAEYYQLSPRTIYKSYPVYHPDRQPPGYLEWLKSREPEIAFDPARLKTRQDWIAAGELVFNAPISFGSVFFSAADVQNPAFFKESGMPVAKDGTIPFARWIIRKKGQPELGSMGCNTCHTRVLPDGAVVPGAQGNNPGDRQGAAMLRRAAASGNMDELWKRTLAFATQFEVPGLEQDPNKAVRAWSLEQLIAAGEAIPAGVTARSHTSMIMPPQIPDLIGVQERRFLDHTGLVRHREIGDLMRYSALVQDTIGRARYGDADVQRSPVSGSRYSDEQLYALALYLYSLQPPANPNRFDSVAASGRNVFEREGCPVCHTPPLYTNNKLIPADGFTPPQDHWQQFEILDRPVGTDPGYALHSRKGTGYYKVPSLKGVWYRGPLAHNGAVATLEDWFDPARLGADYVPTGYAGPDGRQHSVKGHEFGLRLSPEDRRALIAFLRTL